MARDGGEGQRWGGPCEVKLRVACASSLYLCARLQPASQPLKIPPAWREEEEEEGWIIQAIIVALLRVSAWFFPRRLDGLIIRLINPHGYAMER
jgi:hypothetical protein